MNRRELLFGASAATVSTALSGSFAADRSQDVQLAGRRLTQLRDDYHAELFDRVLPFWDAHGVDHQHGGFMCALDYDGTLKHTNKFHWYQGRGIWVHSYLYNHFGGDERYLSIARKAKQFWLRHGRQNHPWWAELLSRTGKVLQPFGRDVYSAFTTAEGLQEYAFAAKDDDARELSFRLVKDAYDRVTRRDYHDPYAKKPGWRVQGIWIYVLNSCTQMLNRWDDPRLTRMADECVDAIINKHYNDAIGLNNEFLAYDFSRLKSEANKSLVGHSLQALWTVMDEAVRRGDEALYLRCAERVRHHLDIGWDHVYGGLCEWVNIDQFDHDWGPQKLGDQTIDLKMKGEYNYIKSFWALNETLLATMHVYHRLQSSWAARYFSLAQHTADHKFSRKNHGQATYLLASNRKMDYIPRSVRQDNYHPLRRLMRNLQALERLAAKSQ